MSVTLSSHRIECSSPPVFNQSLPNLEHEFPDNFCTFYNPNESILCTCTTTNFRSNEMFSFVNAYRYNFSPIFTKFSKLIAEIISKAQFICDGQQKYLVGTELPRF